MTRDDNSSQSSGSSSNQSDQGSGSSSGNQGDTSNRGFASMDPEKQREIAKEGGEASAKSQKRDDQGQFAGN